MNDRVEVLDIVRRANPVPDAVRTVEQLDLSRSLLQAIDQRSGTVDTRQTNETEAPERPSTQEAPGRVQPLRKQRQAPRRPGIAWAAAAFLFVALIGGGLFALTRGNDGGGTVATTPPSVTQTPTTISEPPATFEETLGVVETFWATWNSGDIDATMALVDPDISFPGSAATLRSFMEFVAPHGGIWAVTNCSEGSSVGSVTCHLAHDNALHEALGLTGDSTSIVVRNGLVTSLSFPDYNAGTRALSELAREDDEDAWEGACATPDGVAPLTGGVYATAACGALLASYIDDLVDTLDATASVEAFWATWNSGDIDATMALVDPDISFPGSAATLRSFMEFVAPQTGTWVVTNCEQGFAEGSVECHLAYDNALHAALGLTGSNVSMRISDGLVTSLSFPDYNAASIALSDLAREDDEDGWTAACATPDGVAPLTGGVYATAACGELLTTYMDDLIGTLG